MRGGGVKGTLGGNTLMELVGIGEGFVVREITDGEFELGD
jgi:hypothetical protein